MRVNPGGQIAPSEVIGRDKLIRQLWETLERQGVVLTAERRIGKTSVIKKMVAEAPEGVYPVYQDLEGIRSALEFTERVFEAASDYLRARNLAAERTREFINHLSGAEVSGIKLPDASAKHWKKLLRKIAEDLSEHQDEQPIFFWDELPIMLLNLREREGATVTTEVLDVLRELRHTHDSLRMVFTGSIGMDHVIASLRSKGYTGTPLNDMNSYDVPALKPPYACGLAQMLIQGESIESDDIESVAEVTATSVDFVPYYIHHVVEGLKDRPAPVDADAVEAVVKNALTDAKDQWDMRHFRRRINHYYSTSQQPLALTLLDVLADDEPLAFEALFDRAKGQMELADDEEERVRKMLVLLRGDHYLKFEPKEGYHFRFPLIRRWWRLNRL